jgi:hypothetical protein
MAHSSIFTFDKALSGFCRTRRQAQRHILLFWDRQYGLIEIHAESNRQHTQYEKRAKKEPERNLIAVMIIFPWTGIGGWR